jgi:uncharacterized protein (DUF736 family)
MNTNTNTNQNNKNQELGALWKKKSKAGMSFLSGYINDHDGQRIDVVVFANSNKSNEKAPDFRMYVSKPLDRASGATTNVKAQTQQVKAKVNKPVVAAVVDEDEDLL